MKEFIKKAFTYIFILIYGNYLINKILKEQGH